MSQIHIILSSKDIQIIRCRIPPCWLSAVPPHLGNGLFSSSESPYDYCSALFKAPFKISSQPNSITK